MAMTPAERVKKYQEKCDAIMLRPSKEHGLRIRQAAKEAGKSVQAFILEAVDKRIDWEVELTPEEEEIYNRAMEEDEDLDDALPDVLARARREILKEEKASMKEMGEEWSPGYRLEVHFC